MQHFEISQDILPVLNTDGNGFLVGDIPVTRDGVFEYGYKFGKRLKVLRHKDDVFSEESLKSLKNLIINEDHSAFVNPDNYKEHMKGAIGSNVRVSEDGKVIVDAGIYDKALIDKIKTGKKVQLSAGYTATILPEKGTYKGEAYDARQVDIKYNHITFTEKGRAGDTIRARVADSDIEDYGVMILKDECTHLEGFKCNNKLSKKQKEVSKMQDSEIKDTDNQAYNKARSEYDNEILVRDSKIETLEAKLENLTKTNEQLKKEFRAMEVKLKEFKDSNAQLITDASDDVINNKVRDKFNCFVKAHAMIGDTVDAFADMDNRDLMAATLKQLSDKEMNFEDMEDGEIKGRFNQLYEALTNKNSKTRNVYGKLLNTFTDSETNQVGNAFSNFFNSKRGNK